MRGVVNSFTRRTRRPPFKSARHTPITLTWEPVHAQLPVVSPTTHLLKGQT